MLPELLVELATALVFFLVLRRRPVTSALAALAVATGAGYVSSRFVHSGATITGKERMRALVFAPGEGDGPYAFPHGIFIDERHPVPSHTERSLLIQTKAAALNPLNYKIIPARWPFVRHIRRFTVGYDAAGVVLSVGSDPSCAHVQVGDAVFGLAPLGSIGEYTMLPCAVAAKKPTTLSFDEAAGLNVAALTSLYALTERAQVKKGDHVLVIGAAGGCGSFGVKLAKLLGAEVTAVASAANHALVREIGASHVVDYKDDKEMAALKGGRHYDVVYDTVSSFEDAMNWVPIATPLVKEGGLYVAINGQHSEWTWALLDVLARPLGLSAQRAGYHHVGLLVPHRAGMQQLAKWYETGELSGGVPIDSTFVLATNASAWSAMARQKSRRAVGKIVVKFPD